VDFLKLKLSCAAASRRCIEVEETGARARAVSMGTWNGLVSWLQDVYEYRFHCSGS
jgi:hypothetical protein